MMKILKVMTVIGTRPEAIKLAPVVKKLEKYPDKFKSTVVVTAQHRQMLDQVLKLFKIIPSYDLDIMHDNQTLANATVRIVENFDPLLAEKKPNLIIVQGDTTTTFISGLIS